MPPALHRAHRLRTAAPRAGATSVTQRAPMGSYAKVDVVYDHPFWRKKKLYGQTVSLNGPVRVTFDSTPDEGSPRRAASLRSAAATAQLVRAISERAPPGGARRLRRLLLGEKARDPIFSTLNASAEDGFGRRTNWSPVFGPGTLLDFGTGACARPSGASHWAGTGDLRLLGRLHGRRHALRRTRRRQSAHRTSSRRLTGRPIGPSPASPGVRAASRLQSPNAPRLRRRPFYICRCTPRKLTNARPRSARGRRRRRRGRVRRAGRAHAPGAVRALLPDARLGHDAEESLQDTLLRAWRSAAKFEGRSSASTWLTRSPPTRV